MNTEMVTRTEMDHFKKEIMELLKSQVVPSSGDKEQRTLKCTKGHSIMLTDCPFCHTETKYYSNGGQICKNGHSITVSKTCQVCADTQKVLMKDLIAKCTKYPCLGLNAYFQYENEYWFYYNDMEEKEEQEKLSKIYELTWELVQVFNPSDYKNPHQKPMSEFLNDCCSMSLPSSSWYKHFNYHSKGYFYVKSSDGTFTTEEEANISIAKDKLIYDIPSGVTFYTVKRESKNID